MTTKAKTKKAAAKKAKPEPPTPPGLRADDFPPSPRPVRGLNDTGRVGVPVEGHFVDIVGGEHKGIYGVWESTTPDGKHAVVRGRDAKSDRYSVLISDLAPALAGRR